LLLTDGLSLLNTNAINFIIMVITTDSTPLQFIEIIFANSKLLGCCETIFCGFLSRLRGDHSHQLANATSNLELRNRQLS